MKHLKQTVYKSDLNAQHRSNTSVNNHYCNFIFGQLQQLLKNQTKPKQKLLIQKRRKQKEKSKETVFRQT